VIGLAHEPVSIVAAMNFGLQRYSICSDLGICIALFLSVGDTFSQSASKVESILVKKRAGAYRITPPPTESRPKSMPLQAPAQGSFTVGRGAELASGTEDGTVLILDTVGSARMESHTTVRVPSEPGVPHSLEQLSGTLYFNINAEDLRQTQRSEFRLKTPAALLAVKGTHFFAKCGGGTDLIGVHEGLVWVHEPISDKSVTLTAGQTVKVQRGFLGEVRPLTAEEDGNQSLYASLEIASVALPFFQTSQGTSSPSGNALVIAWDDLLLRDSTTPPPAEPLKVWPSTVDSNGALRLAWSDMPSLKPPAVFWSSGKLHIPAGIGPPSLKPVAFRALVRASGCSDVLAGIRQLGGGEGFSRQTVQQRLLPTDGQWMFCLVEIPAGISDVQIAVMATPGIRQDIPIGLPFESFLNAIVPSPASRLQLVDDGSIEIKDVRLLLGPKDEGVE
jgi:hypothetical protein